MKNGEWETTDKQFLEQIAQQLGIKVESNTLQESESNVILSIVEAQEGQK